MMNILGYTLVETCGACPEQYDVFKDNKQVAYFRLRHGTFRVDVPVWGGETIYTANPKGDGIFKADERDYYLTEAIRAVEKYYGSSFYTIMDFDKLFRETSLSDLLIVQHNLQQIINEKTEELK